VSLAAIILTLVTLQRLGELVLARRNTEKLKARGAIEIGAKHYPLVVSVHAAWLIALWVFGRDHDVNLVALAIFVLLQALRVWILLTLGSRWTTRIIVLRGEPLIVSGPYRYLSHPNYAVVVGEIAVLPLALHLPAVAIVFSLLNVLVLVIRIRAEQRALSAASGGFSRASP
jgi:methyltransferase